jgi:Sulfotransferase family
VIGARPAAVGNDGLPRDPGRFRPLFLLAPARSCSSVVVAMLGQHPRLYGFPELRLFRAARVGQLLVEPAAGDGMPARERAAGLLRALAQLHDGEQSPESVDRAWQWLRQRQDWDVAAVLDELLRLIAPVTGVEKSPETSLTDGALVRAARAYPQARYVHLVRHPWSTVASMTVAWGPLDYWHVPRDRAAQFCATVWLEQHRRILDFGARLGPDRFLRLRAEDILNQPADVLASVCRWLGIEDDGEHVAAMSAPELSPYASPGPPNASGGFDPSFLRWPRRRDVTLPASLAAPASWRLECGTYHAVIGLARRLGYGAAGQGVSLGRPGLGRHRLPSAASRGHAEARDA